MTYPKVSVIVPFYNSEEYLEQCLKSILDQTLFSFELILIDDGSTDQSLNICIKYAQRDSRIQIYKQSHKGPGPARNLGIKLANGKYLSFLDSDDFFEPNMLEKLYHCAERTNAETIFYWYSKFDNFKQNNITIIPNRYLKRIPHNRPFNPLNHSDILFQLSGSEAWKYFFRTDLIHQYNLKFAQTTCGEDIPKFIEALDAGFDFIQGSRFTKGGVHENTPLVRLIANKMILIPWIRFLSHYHYTEVASAYRGISMRFLNDVTMDIGRDCFIGYELLWYMSVMAPRLGYKVTEIPVRRIYPKGPTPTKITCSRCFGIIFQLLNITLGKYNRKI